MIARDPWDPPELVDPFAPPAIYPMHLPEYDAIRDDIKAAMFDDRALLPDLLNEALAALATIAQTGVEADNKLATQCLRRMCQRAVTGVPFNEREVQL